MAVKLKEPYQGGWGTLPHLPFPKQVLRFVEKAVAAIPELEVASIKFEGTAELTGDLETVRRELPDVEHEHFESLQAKLRIGDGGTLLT